MCYCYTQARFLLLSISFIQPAAVYNLLPVNLETCKPAVASDAHWQQVGNSALR